MARIFISHSSRDNEAAARMKAWLASWGFESAFLDFDKMTGISPGANWEKTLYREVERSQAVVILQTPNWLDSKWCFAEFVQARALGKAIFPVIETTTGDTRIAPDIQTLDLTADRAGGLVRLARELARYFLVDAQSGFAWDPSRPPFPGLLAFQEEDAAVYFGRDDECRRLIERLEARRVQGSAKLIALLGSSGSGKSSLLRAGVIPRLKRAGRNWIVAPPMRPAERPVDALAVALAAAKGPAADWRRLKYDLIGPAPKRALEDLANDLRVGAGASDARILIPIDQAEELFGVTERDEAERFLQILGQALSEGLPFQTLMVLRSDFLGQLQSAPALTPRFEEFSLGPLPSARIPEIIRGPALVAGFSVEETFVQQAALDAESEDALPLLAFALRELVDRSPDRSLTLDGYKALGDENANLTPLENVARKTADRVLAEAKPSEDELVALREAFIPAMVRVNDKGEYVSRQARWEELPAKSHSLLKLLARERVLIVRQDGDARVVEVAHDALLRKWPLLRTWLDVARDFLIRKPQLEQDVRDWEQAEEADRAGALLTGLKLNRARTWLVEHPMQLTPQERTFIQASIDDSQVARESASKPLYPRRTEFSAPAGQPRYYVSYAWADQNDPNRERDVDHLCDEARKRGIQIIRDKRALNYGDLISDFILRISEGDRIFVFISDKYLRSPYCMQELFEIWRNSRQNKAEFLRRVRSITIDGTRLKTPLEWIEYAMFWKKQRDSLKKAIDELGWEDTGQEVQNRYKAMRTFTGEVSDILSFIADTVRPQSFEEFLRYGLDDTNERASRT